MFRRKLQGKNFLKLNWMSILRALKLLKLELMSSYMTYPFLGIRILINILKNILFNRFKFFLYFLEYHTAQLMEPIEEYSRLLPPITITCWSAMRSSALSAKWLSIEIISLDVWLVNWRNCKNAIILFSW